MHITAPGRQKIAFDHTSAFTPSVAARWAPVPLRLIVGCGMMQHGLAKLSRGPDAFAATLHGLSVPAPHLMAWLTILIEVAGGLTTLVGLAIPLFALPMTAVLIIAMLKVHLQFGFSSIKLVSAALGHPQFGPPGYECDLLYLACIAALVMGGPGPLAIDTLLFRNVRLRQ